MYDYTIIGGGPSGIYCADKLSILGYKVCLIESLETLGGCHRVRYVTDNKGNIIHTEHGPRVYLGSYIDFWKWIKTINIDRDNNFEKYKFDMFSKDFIGFITMFKLHEILSIIFMYITNCLLKLSISNDYTLEQFSNDFKFSENGKHRLNRLARLIDGGNLNKSLLGAFVEGIDTGFAYNIYQPNESMDNLLWDKFTEKLVNQKVDILLKTKVTSINKNTVNIGNNTINTDNIILALPPYALNKIKNAPSLVGYDPIKFNELSNYQQYEPYVCCSIKFKNYGESSWGISDSHPWGIIAIDMGRYFKTVEGSLFIVSVTHPEKIDPDTNKSANDMEEDQFLDRIVDLVKIRFKLNEEPVYKTFSPNVKKINGTWIETDRAFLFSPPGWLTPDFNISKLNKIYTTGHHIGNSHHDYNSMESAIQNASGLLSKIEPNYTYSISEPWKLSDIILIILITLILIMVYRFRKYIRKYIRQIIRKLR